MSGASGEIRRWQRRGEVGRGAGGGRGGNSVGAGSFKKKKKKKPVQAKILQHRSAVFCNRPDYRFTVTHDLESDVLKLNVALSFAQPTTAHPGLSWPHSR